MDYAFYENLIPSRSSTKPKYMAFLHMLLEHSLNLTALVESMNLAFDLDNAAGSQLDIIGGLVGVNRVLPYMPTAGDRRLTDDEYRLMIQLKIAVNAWDGTNQGAMDIYRMIFDNYIRIEYEDTQDMSISVTINDALTTREADILNGTGNLLVPSGVSLNFTQNGGSAQIITYVDAQAVDEEIFVTAKMV